MAKGKRVCKICGAEYEYCRTQYRDTDIFRWQDVACCQSHGSEYFAKILASRSVQTVPSSETVEVTSAQETTVPVDNDEETVSSQETITETLETDGDSNKSLVDNDSSSQIDI